MANARLKKDNQESECRQEKSAKKNNSHPEIIIKVIPICSDSLKLSESERRDGLLQAFLPDIFFYY